MDKIDVYVREVGRNLPPKTRSDIEKEIRSLIEDTLEDESASQGRAVDEAMLMDVLRRLGSPTKMAASYLPPRYLIGPQLFPYYLSTLRVIAPIVTLLVALGLGLSIGANAQETGGLFAAILRALGGLVNALFITVATVTLIFAILQWTVPGFKLDEEPWDPRQLKAEPDPERVKIGEKVTEIVLLVFCLILFNLFPEWVGGSFLQNGQWVHIPVLSQAFSLYLPWLSLLWVVEIGRNVWLVARGRWSNLLRWVTVGLSLGEIAIAAWMLTGPSILSIDPGAFARIGWDVTPQAAASIINGLNTSVRLVIGLTLAVGIYNLGEQLYKFLLRDRLAFQITRKG